LPIPPLPESPGHLKDFSRKTVSGKTPASQMNRDSSKRLFDFCGKERKMHSKGI
jgi:hypothetical protein